MTFNPNTSLAHEETLRSGLDRLRSSGDDVRADAQAAADTRAIGAVCRDLLVHVESLTLFLNDLVIEQPIDSGAGSSDPVGVVRACIAGAQDQVKQVMSNEYEVDVARKRLSMASGLADAALESLSHYIDEVSTRQAHMDTTDGGSSGWRG